MELIVDVASVLVLIWTAVILRKSVSIQKKSVEQQENISQLQQEANNSIDRNIKLEILLGRLNAIKDIINDMNYYSDPHKKEMYKLNAFSARIEYFISNKEVILYEGVDFSKSNNWLHKLIII
ncbi:MAG TPA: hypothetical protein VFM99_08835 [Chitinophagales bacterium]|nr:hypothetical protein [Chitinophagales bacterium]